jgi:hypothetical protein
MSKKGQHKNDHHDSRISSGPNDPKKSVTITTGSYKKPETTDQQRFEHEDPHKQGQSDKNEWNEDHRKMPSHTGATRAREVRSGRSGSDSNADRGSKG